MEAIHKPVGHLDTNALRVSRYDQVTSSLVALLILVGAAVIGMFIVWLTAATTHHGKHGVPVEYLGHVAEPKDPPNPGGELTTPEIEEVPELLELQVQPSVAALTDAVSNVAALKVASNPAPNSHDRSLGPPGGGPNNIIPRGERWEIRFESASINAYARQLDYFQIELGAGGGGKPSVDYAFNLTKGRPDTRSESGSHEQRLYMTWRGGTLQQFDRELLRRAGIELTSRFVLQFYPAEVEQALAQVEREHAEKQGRTPPEYRQTVFGVEGSAGGWKFTVLEQRFRPLPRQQPR